LRKKNNDGGGGKKTMQLTGGDSKFIFAKLHGRAQMKIAKKNRGAVTISRSGKKDGRKEKAKPTEV